MYRRALAIREKVLGPEHADTAETINGWASLLDDIGDRETAESLLRRALEIRQTVLGPEHPDTAESFDDLGRLLVSKRDYAAAESMYRRALAIRENLFGPDGHWTSFTLMNLANLNQFTGNLAAAEQLYRRVLKIHKDLLGFDDLQTAYTGYGLADVLSEKGEYAEAEALYRRALAVTQKIRGEGHTDTHTLTYSLARLLSDKGDKIGALDLFRKASEAGHKGSSSYLATLRSVFDEADTEEVQALVAESFDIAQETTFTSASEALANLGARFAAGPGQLSKLVREEQDQWARYSQLEMAFREELSKPAEERRSVAEALEELEVARLAHAKIRDRLSADFPDYFELLAPRVVTIDEVQFLLRNDEALVFIHTVNKDGPSYIWVINRTVVIWEQLETGDDEIAEIVSELRRGLDPKERRAIDPALAYRLYELTLEPVAQSIEHKSHLIFVINGAMTSLPPQVMVTADPSGKKLADVDWLIKRHAITVLPAVSSLKVLRGHGTTTAAGQPIRAYADPLFSAEARNEANVTLAARGYGAFYRGGMADIEVLSQALFSLPETADEARAVARSLGGSDSDVVVGREATETAIKEAKLDDYRVLYFATHALLAGEVEEYAGIGAEPALALSIPETATERDDGLLTASEAALLKLNADWVVLSACNTAAGDKPGAEALSGLARAFFYAGARSLLVSHWPVESQSAVALMTTTFDRLSSDPTLSAAEALRQAMLAVMTDADHPKWAQPRYWAPFILVGQPGSL